MPLPVWLSALWTETDWWRSAWRLKLGECTCKSIPLLIAVASLCRYPDASACLVVRFLTETDWWRSAWRLKLGECTSKSIPLLIAVASLFRYPEASACLVVRSLVVRSLDRD